MRKKLGRQFEKEAFPEMNEMAKQFQDAKVAEKEKTQISELDSII